MGSAGRTGAMSSLVGMVASAVTMAVSVAAGTVFGFGKGGPAAGRAGGSSDVPVKGL